MPTCIRCQKNVGLLGQLSFNRQTNRYGTCQKEIQQSLNGFRNDFLGATGNSLISEERWQTLTNAARGSGLEINEALAFVRGDAIHFLERSLTFFFADSFLDATEENYIHTMIEVLAIPRDLAYPLLERLRYLKFLTGIRQGILPQVQPSIHLESGELCHMEMDATYQKVNARSITMQPGRLVATT